MQVIFYKASYGNVVDKIIAWWTSSIPEKFSGAWRRSYSHVELLFSDSDMFSASQYENATRFRLYNTSSERWERVDVPLSASEEETIRSFCNEHDGKQYDYKGILGFVFGTRDNSDKWFCSEVVTAGLQSVGIVPDLVPSKTSPNKLYKELQEYLQTTLN